MLDERNTSALDLAEMADFELFEVISRSSGKTVAFEHGDLPRTNNAEVLCRFTFPGGVADFPIGVARSEGGKLNVFVTGRPLRNAEIYVAYDACAIRKLAMTAH